MIFFIENSDLLNYADDNTITAWANSIRELINTLESESDIAIKWFKDNEMIVNPDKFQAIITSKNSVTLLGLEIDDRLSFDSHTHSLIKKSAGQLNYMISKNIA